MRELAVAIQNSNKQVSVIETINSIKKENTSEWMEINELLKKEKILSAIMILDRFFIKGLVNDNFNFKMHIQVDEEENILEINYKLCDN